MKKKERLGLQDNIYLVHRDRVTGQVMAIQSGHNIVTQAGLNHLARAMVDGTQTLTLYSRAQISLVATVIKAPTVEANRSWFSIPTNGTDSMDAGWPQINGSDSGNNPGSFGTDITTFKTTFAASAAVDTIKGVAMHGPEARENTSRPIFNYSTFTRANWRVKTASDLLTAYVNIEYREN